MSRFDNRIKLELGGYNVLLETDYNLWIENLLLILYDHTGHTPKQTRLIIMILPVTYDVLY